jgi:hypothetical protein
MKSFEVKIEGITPYMQHRMDDQKLEEWEKTRHQIIERDDVAKEDLLRAEFHSYRDGVKGKYFIPSDQIQGAMINAGALSKSKVGNAKKSMKNIVAAMFSINPEKIFLANSYEIDKRSAVNRNIKARVICIRPRWDKWQAEFTLLIDNDTITESTARQILEDAGNYIGIGSFRPQNNGKYGRFKITKFNKVV